MAASIRSLMLGNIRRTAQSEIANSRKEALSTKHYQLSRAAEEAKRLMYAAKRAAVKAQVDVTNALSNGFQLVDQQILREIAQVKVAEALEATRIWCAAEKKENHALREFQRAHDRHNRLVIQERNSDAALAAAMDKLP